MLFGAEKRGSSFIAFGSVLLFGSFNFRHPPWLGFFLAPVQQVLTCWKRTPFGLVSLSGMRTDSVLVCPATGALGQSCWSFDEHDSMNMLLQRGGGLSC